MTWNWQQADWPHFNYDFQKVKAYEQQLLLESGALLGAFQHLTEEDKNLLKIDLLSEEALKTSEIEGEYLNRESVQSSIRKQFGLIGTTDDRIPAAEQGVAEMTVDLYRSYAEPLSHEKLFQWHKMLMRDRPSLDVIGGYRTHKEAMQVVSGPAYKPRIHFEAPPSERVFDEMTAFIDWFNRTAPQESEALPALIRAGIAHLYFVSIHPFEDGNGRIARAISEKALSQGLGKPTLIALAYMIAKHKKHYYDALENANKGNEITPWLIYFCETVIAAVAYTHTKVSFLIEKTKFFDRYREKLNNRQEKVLLRMFKEGPEGFTGGLSAENYISITKTSRATATRDLQGLVDIGALKKRGELRYTRYYLEI